MGWWHVVSSCCCVECTYGHVCGLLVDRDLLVVPGLFHNFTSDHSICLIHKLFRCHVTNGLLRSPTVPVPVLVVTVPGLVGPTQVWTAAQLLNDKEQRRVAGAPERWGGLSAVPYGSSEGHLVLGIVRTHIRLHQFVFLCHHGFAFTVCSERHALSTCALLELLKQCCHNGNTFTVLLSSHLLQIPRIQSVSKKGGIRCTDLLVKEAGCSIHLAVAAISGKMCCAPQNSDLPCYPKSSHTALDLLIKIFACVVMSHL